jgi:O-antigen/teichoic acid export membrane protein
MSLRRQAVRGGAYLFARQGLGIVIATVGVVLLTRTIGPASYGIYAAAFGVYTYFFMLSQWGVEVYLIRREGEVQPQDYHQAFSLLLLLGLVGAGVAILALPFLERWVRLEGFGPVAIALFAGLPITLLSRVPLAHLERALDYRSVGLIELSVLTVFYLVAVALAYKQLGPWAPVGGWWAQELLRFGLLYRVSAYRPRLYWEYARVRSIMGYGLGYSASIWIWHLRVLVNPLVVGPYAGANAVGYVALTIRIVEQLSFIKDVAWRLSIAVLARLQEDRIRLLNAVTTGMSLQVLALGAPLVGFALFSPWIIPTLFGSQWFPVLEIYPFIALSYLSNTLFNLHSSTLLVLRRNWEAASFGLGHIVLFAGSAMLLVPYLGIKGYGWAEVVALPSYILLHIWLVTYVGRPKYTQAMIWYVAWAITLFSTQLGLWRLIIPVLPLLWPTTRQEIVQVLKTIIPEKYLPAFDRYYLPRFLKWRNRK